MATKSSWTFFTNHAHVLLCLYNNPERPLREISLEVGITERAVQRIVAELAEDGFLEIEKQGRQNVYKMHLNRPLRHGLEAHRTIEDVLKVLKK